MVSEVFWLQRIYAFKVAEVIELVFVFYTNFLLSLLFFFIVRCSRQALKSSLLLNSIIVDIAILSSPTQVQHAERVNKHAFFNLVVKRRVCHKAW